ncbi:MAG: Crp/Fnr family transcriptional regulator [Chthoniobacterales bacterium]
MNSADLESGIAATPFVQGMSHRHVEFLASCACRIHFNGGQIIFRQSETANRFYLIEAGAVELLAATKSGNRRIVAGNIGPDGVLGWSWLFPPYEWQFTARASWETSAIFFYATILREHCEADPSLGFELFKRMAAEMVKRLQSARRRLLESRPSFSLIDGEPPITAEPRLARWKD